MKYKRSTVVKVTLLFHVTKDGRVHMSDSLEVNASYENRKFGVKRILKLIPFGKIT